TTTTNFATVTTQTISGSITAPTFNKFGLGTLILSGTNSGMTGTWTINSGTLQFANAQSINDRTITMAGGNLTFNPGLRTNATVRVVTDTGTFSPNTSSISTLVFGSEDDVNPFFVQLINSNVLAVRDSVQLTVTQNWWQANNIATV